MRPQPVEPTAIPLPPVTPVTQRRRQHAGDHAISGAAITRFNDLLHELHPDAPHVDVDWVASVARWLLELPQAQAVQALDERLARADELRRMLVDPDWDADQALRNRLGKLLTYIDTPGDLIPDDVPLIGLLDDILLIELAWPAFADAAGDYRDYCQYRDAGDKFAAAAVADASARRADWIQTRLRELALHEQRLRVRAHQYAPHDPPTDNFHIG